MLPDSSVASVLTLFQDDCAFLSRPFLLFCRYIHQGIVCQEGVILFSLSLSPGLRSTCVQPAAHSPGEQVSALGNNSLHSISASESSNSPFIISVWQPCSVICKVKRQMSAEFWVGKEWASSQIHLWGRGETGDEGNFDILLPKLWIGWAEVWNHVKL